MTDFPTVSDLSRLLDRTHSDPAELHTLLTKYREIPRMLRKVHDRVAAEVQRHEAEITKLRVEANEIRAACDHPRTNFHGDPAGGSDKWYECVICGASIK